MGLHPSANFIAEVPVDFRPPRSGVRKRLSVTAVWGPWFASWNCSQGRVHCAQSPPPTVYWCTGPLSSFRHICKSSRQRDRHVPSNCAFTMLFSHKRTVGRKFTNDSIMDNTVLTPSQPQRVHAYLSIGHKSVQISYWRSFQEQKPHFLSTCITSFGFKSENRVLCVCFFLCVFFKIFFMFFF